MRVGGIWWGRRPPKAGGGPVLRRRPARRAVRRPKHLASFRRFLIANGISATLQERVSLGSLLEGLRADIGTVLILVQLVNARYAGMGQVGVFGVNLGGLSWRGGSFFRSFSLVWRIYSGYGWGKLSLSI